VQEILRRAQEVEDEITGQTAPAQINHKLVGAAGRGKGYST
jgi:hypothetical protein